MDNKVIANLKTLGVDMINKAGSGHPGIVLSSAPILYTVYANHMHINIKDNNWLNRDRFVMSAGHGSALLYATLYMCGFLTLDDLKEFRQVKSKTPGHPEYKITPGVEVSTGPLGQGLATAVGMAIGEKHLASTIFNNDIIDYYIYTLCGDGDLMEGISYEAASLAGTLKLNNLIVLYDSNKISLDGETSHTFTEDILERFDALGWFVMSVKNKPFEIDRAINKAKKSGLPSLIEVKTLLGEGSILENTNKVHGKPLGMEDIKQLKEKLNMPLEEFYVDEKALHYFKEKIKNRSSNKYIAWQKKYQSYINNILNGNDIRITDFYNQDFSFLEEEVPFDVPLEEATRDSNHKVMNYISGKKECFIGGSADLASSTKTYLDDEGDFNASNYQGKNIWYGVREHAMGAISNGLALTNYLPFCSTFLTFADYLKPAIRMSALMELPVTYIFTHDSINVGEDGPTHQPIEQLAMLRSIPNFTVYRPADFNEVLGSWQAILKNKKPCALILSRGKTYNSHETKSQEVIKGAYIIKSEKKKIDGILIATGTELGLVLNIALELEKEGYDLRVVSMPSTQLFIKQDKEYQNSILPVGYKKIIVEASNDYHLRKFVSHDKYLININSFGVSAPSYDVLRALNFDKDSIKSKIKELL